MSVQNFSDRLTGTRTRGTRVGLGALVVFSMAACGGDGSNQQETVSRTVRVAIDQSGTQAEDFGLTGDEPAFIGIGFTRADGTQSSFALQSGENEIQVEARPGASVSFAATLMTARPGDPYVLYTSEAYLSRLRWVEEIRWA